MKEGIHPEQTQRMSVMKPNLDNCSTTRLQTPYPDNAIQMETAPLSTEDTTEAMAWVLKSIFRVRTTLWTRHNAVTIRDRPRIRMTPVNTGCPKKPEIRGAVKYSAR